MPETKLQTCGCLQSGCEAACCAHMPSRRPCPRGGGPLGMADTRARSGALDPALISIFNRYCCTHKILKVAAMMQRLAVGGSVMSAHRAPTCMALPKGAASLRSLPRSSNAMVSMESMDKLKCAAGRVSVLGSRRQTGHHVKCQSAAAGEAGNFILALLMNIEHW